MFIPSYRLGGGPIEAHVYEIATATAITKGSFVKLTVGTGVEAYAGTDADDPILGVAAQDHAANSGTSILVYDAPDIVYEWVGKHLSTTTGGDATSWIDSSLVGANDVFNGGHVVIVSTNSIAGFSVGDVLSITDYVSAQGDATVTGAGGTIAAGMTGYIYPGKLAEGYFGFDTDAGIDDIDFDTDGGEAIRIHEVKWEPNKKSARVFVQARLHLLGNSTLAI